MAKNNFQIICKNIFKSNDAKTIQDEFTKKFIELVNQLEKSKVNITLR